MPWTEILVLLFAAVAAGAVNAVAGGGTLLTFPALLFVGTPPVVANATNTLALMLGTAGGMVGYRRHLPAIRGWLWRFGVVSVVGGLLGSALLTATSERTFGRIVPFLILFATLLFMTQGPLRRLVGARAPLATRGTLLAAGAFQFLVAVYGGYFGAGIGILMLASLGLLGHSHIHEMNALKTVLSSLINLVAAAWFVAAGLIHWPRAAVMTIGALAGYYLGSRSSQAISQARVRQVITAIGLVLSVVTFYREFQR